MSDPHSPVADDEVLFRSVRPGEVRPQPDGSLQLSSQAFADKQRQPSVDREILRTCPCESRKGPKDFIFVVVAGEVRKAAGEARDKKGLPTMYPVNVQPDPFPEEAPDNASHALIVPEMPPATKSWAKMTFLENLARLAVRRAPRLTEHDTSCHPPK